MERMRYMEKNKDDLFKKDIAKIGIFKKNDIGNDFWENIGFAERNDLVYRNKNIHVLNRNEVNDNDKRSKYR